MEVKIEMKSKLKLLYNVKEKGKSRNIIKEIRESLTGAE
jgi:hypothetical protein